MNCSIMSRLSDAESISKGTAFDVRSHSPLNALISQLLNSASLLAYEVLDLACSKKLTVVHNPIRIVKENGMITVGEDMDIIVLHPS